MTREQEDHICSAWNKLLKIAVDAKQSFSNNAAEAMRFYASPNHNFMFDSGEDMLKVTINKVYELVSLYGPHLYSQDPIRNVVPRLAGNPDIAAAADIFLNYLPSEFAYKSTMEQAITDALISGRGCTYTGIDKRSGLPMTVAEDSGDIFIDPSEKLWYNSWFIMRVRRDRPLWEIKRDFGAKIAKRLEPGDAKKANVMTNQPLTQRPREFDAEDDGERVSYDAPRVTYIEVYSKMGSGLRGVSSEKKEYARDTKTNDNVLIIYEPSQKVLMHQGEWPISFWADHGRYSWPVSFFDPAESRDHTWPISLITPALGQQRWLNWAASFLLSQAKVSYRNILIGPSDTPGNLITELQGNKTNIWIPVDEPNPERRKEYIHRLDLPEISSQFLLMIEYAEGLFEKATGLYEIMYGQTRKQFRSAEEAKLKGSYSRVRIDAMIERVEEWQADIARKEVIAARELLGPEELLPIVGPELAAKWNVYSEGDLQSIIREYDYRIIAGSMRRLTPQRRAEIASEALERFGEVWINTQNLDALNQQIQEWYVANGVPNPQRFLLKAPPPTEAAQPPGPPEVTEIRGGEPVMGEGGV